MKQRLLSFALIFCAGIYLAARINFPYLLVFPLSVSFLLAAFVLFKRDLGFDLALIFFILALGMAWEKNSYRLPDGHIFHQFKYRQAEIFILKGYIDTQPEFRGQEGSFFFRVEEAQAGGIRKNARGRVMVLLKGERKLNYGDALILRGRLRRPFNRGYRAFLRRQGAWFILRAKSGAEIIELRQNKGFWLKKTALRMKRRCQEIFYCSTPPLAAGLLSAMVLGDKKGVPGFINDTMMKTGTLHILVVSGFNVGIVAFLIILLLKLFRVHRRVRPLAAIPLLFLYCLLTGGSNPVARATLMGIMFLLSYLFQREPDTGNALGLSALCILLANPDQLFDVGFQLSFLSVAAISFLYPRLKLLLRLDSLKARWLKRLIENGLVSFSAWLGTMGLIAFNFKIFAPVTVLANIFVVPLAGLITLCGFTLIAAYLFLPVAITPLSSLSEALAKLMYGLNSFFSGLPGAYFRLP